MYRLSPRNNTPSALRAAATAPNVGKLDITWRHSGGNVGRLQTAHFVRKQLRAAPPALELHVLNAPRVVTLEDEFQLDW